MLTAGPEFSTRMPNQHPDIMPGSPSALLAVFTEIIRERFRVGNNLPWLWDGAAVSKPDAKNLPGSPRKVLIEPAFSETSEARNVRPAIYIDRGPILPNKVAIADSAGQQLTTGMRAFYSVAQVPISVQVEASRKGESSVLADTVWFYLLAGIPDIRKAFDFQDISLPQLGQTTAVDRDKTAWVTPISFTVTTNLRWTTLPDGSLLTVASVQANAQEVISHYAGQQ